MTTIRELYLAICNGQLEIVKSVIDESPQVVNVVTRVGHLTLENGQLEVAKLLLDENAPQLSEKATDHCRTALHLAFDNGHPDMAKLLIEKAPGIVNIDRPDGSTALHYACMFGHLEIVELLLGKWPHLVDLPDTEGRTVFHSATKCGHLEIAKLLLSKAPHLLSVKDDTGRTAVDNVSRHGKPKTVEFLLETSMEFQSKQPELLLRDATKLGHLAVVNVLLEKWPKLATLSDSYGWTVLHWASRFNRPCIVEAILKKSPEILMIRDCKCETALDVSRKLGCFEAEEVLKQALDRRRQQNILVFSYSPLARLDLIRKLAPFLHDLVEDEFTIDWSSVHGSSVADSDFYSKFEAIRRCKVFICFVCDAYDESSTCQRELECAVKNQKQVIAVRIQQDFEPTSRHLCDFGDEMIDYLDDEDDEQVEWAAVDIYSRLQIDLNGIHSLYHDLLQCH